VTEDELMPIVEKVILWYRENALPKERLGKTVDRLGIEVAEAAILSDDILARRDEILAKEI
jgi:dissimilatory sulfite reductase (desulfoviridin) alpha/beta subunit